MAELLIRVHDKRGEDVFQDAQLTKRGDVICVCPDGWPWSKMERIAPYWRIVRAPIPLDEAEALVQPERPADETDMRETLLRRQFRLDVDDPALPAAVRAFFDDDSRAESLLDLGSRMSAGEFRRLKKTKPRVQDPRFR